LFSQQEISGSIYTSLDELEGTLLGIQSENESLKSGMETLKESLLESEAANRRLSALSAELRTLSEEQEQAYARQSRLLEGSEKSLRRWRLASIVEGTLLLAVIAAVILR
jgi:DNA repair exonuclease SbcCD ATPase subunit